MANPYSSGGGGTHFEARVTAAYLAAVLSVAPARGVPGQYATQVRTQRAAFGESLDDVIVTGQLANGRSGTLHLQVKSKLTFTASDTEWVSVLEQAWTTFTGSFNSDFDRLGVAISAYSARADKHYQSVLKWAAHSANGRDFLQRIEKKDFSSQSKHDFVQTVRNVIAKHAGGPVDDDSVWRFLRSFVILHFDLELETGSRDAEQVIDRIRAMLPSTDRQAAGGIWDHLVAKAGDLIPVGGSASRCSLVRQLDANGYPTGTAPTAWRDVEAIDKASAVALSYIKSDIHGLHLHRKRAYDKVQEALIDGRFVQIDGEPGTGKSALLKEIAEEARRSGPVFVLKDNRITANGWDAHAHILSISHDAASLLREFGTAGESILFIDGIDKITDPTVQLTVNDLLKLIADDPTLTGWRILTSVREQNLEHIATWLDPDALAKLPVRTVTVEPLEKDELGIVASEFPRLRPLLMDAGNADVILRRPFFLEAVLRLAGQEGASQLPASEVELLRLWWQHGGSEQAPFADAQRRRNVLIGLADKFVRAPNEPIPISNIDPVPLEALKSAGVVIDKEFGHSVAFSHDIYEEWALCELLIGKLAPLVAFLHEVKEPQILLRPVQLLGAYLLETKADESAWQALYEALSDQSLRPVWMRAVLTSCLHSTRTTELLGKLSDYLMASDSRRLRTLLMALRTIEVIPNPLFLNETLIPDLEPRERAQYAHHTALPKTLIWLRFLDWFMAQPGSPWADLLVDLLPVFATWQSAWGGNDVRHCREIGRVSYQWLIEFESARRPVKWEDHRDPFDLSIKHDDKDELEKKIRTVFMNSAKDVPELTKAYLADHGSRERPHIFRDRIANDLAIIARHAPSDCVDYILKAFLESPHEEHGGRDDYPDRISRDYGVAGSRTFYPASPIQPPFLLLLRYHETEGLRLVRALCNHSIGVWRWLELRSDYYSLGVTPIPVTVIFPWGKQTFWGNGQVYLWFRGVWGSEAVESALMALEQWAFEQIDAGRPFEEIFRLVIEGNDTVSALGLGVSLSLAYPDKAADSVYPLVTCPYVWKWDIPRLLQDSSPTNAIGNWFKDRIQLSAVRALNEKPHRKQDIRAWLPYFALHPDAALRKRYAAAVRKFPKNLPFEAEEERADPAIIDELRERMRIFSEQADPRYWKVSPVGDGQHFYAHNDPPYMKAEKYVRQIEDQERLNKAVGLSVWASTTLDKGVIGERFTLLDALAQGKELDREDLFEKPIGLEQFHEIQERSAVAGVAYAVAKYSDETVWTDETAAWCFDVIQRAATTPERQDALSVRGSILSMHPVVFAVHGYAALLARKQEVAACQEGLLNLSVDAAEGIVATVATSAHSYGDQQPDFYWVLFNTLLRQCLVHGGAYPDYHSSVWDEVEAAHKLDLLDAAEAALATKALPALPDIPRPWIKATGTTALKDARTGEYQRNDDVILWHLAEEAILKAPIVPLLIDSNRRQQFLGLVTDLLDATIQTIVPPFSDSRRDAPGNTPFQWIFAFANWLGKIAMHLTPSEATAAILGPISAADDEAALLIMQSFVPGFMINGLLVSDVTDDRLAIWEDVTEWVFTRREAKAAHNSPSRDFTNCALATLFCAHGDFGPLVCGVDQGWPHIKRFEAVVEKAVRLFSPSETLYLAVSLFFRKGGFDLLPEPGLQWLRNTAESKKQDQTFWQANGDDTVEILKMLLDEKADLLTTEHRETISKITDILVDNGVRGAGFLQQEDLRP